VYSSVVLSIFTLLCNQSPELFISQNWNFVITEKTSLFHFLQPLVPPLYFLFLRVLTILDTSYKWNRAVSVLLWLAYFTYLCSPSSSMLSQMTRFSFLRINNIPLCICIHTLHHNCFIHSLTDGPCFHGLAVVNNATMNVGVQLSFRINVETLF